MTRRRPAILAAACSLACISLPAQFCRADSAPAAAQTVSAVTQSVSVDSEASEAAVPAAPSAQPVRRYHRRVSRHSSIARRLPSRGILSAAEAPASVVGRLAIVTSDKAVIVAGSAAAGRVLSVCPKGQYLALSGQTPTQYAVLMVDHSLGFVSRSDVQLLQYQVVNTAPDAAAESDGQASAGSPNTLGFRLVQTAERYLDVPYVWGGNTAAGIDCSGFVKAVYGTYGLTLPRHSGDQAAVGYDVPRSDWAQWVPGDRMYFACHHPEIDHTGMYIGGGYFIHASAGHGHKVAIDRVDGEYYADHLVCVRRSRELLGDAPAPGPVASASAAIPSASPALSSASVDDPEAGQN